MINTQIPEVDAMLAELEATVLGMVEANVLKAGELARLRNRVVQLEAQVKDLTVAPQPQSEVVDTTKLPEEQAAEPLQSPPQVQP